MTLIHVFPVVEEEKCHRWNRNFIEVIDTERPNSYSFSKGAWPSYQLESSISYHNSTTGEWQFFNLSGNIIVLQNSLDHLSLEIKVTRVSPNLTKFKGYFMKLGLKRKRLYGTTEEKSCLLFKAKGEVRFGLDCIVPTTPPVTTTTTATPSTSTITSTTTGYTTTTGTLKPDNSATIATVAIVLGGAVLVLSLIVVVYRYRYMCGLRGLQARNPEIDLDVISYPGPQTYRVQEEPLYAEVPDNFPPDKGCAANEWEEKATVLLNPNVYEAQFLVQRRTTDPLPSRPELTKNTTTQVDAGPVSRNDEGETIGEATEDSIVFKNPKVEEATLSSLPRSENDFTKLSGAHEPEGQSIDDHHHHVENDIDNSTVHPESEGTGENLDYQVLLPGKRPHSVFICPSCNDNPVYQRLSMPHSCPHGTKDKPEENRASFYESLRGHEPGSQESVYARPSRNTEESVAEYKLNRNSEEGEGQPKYHTLEQEEAAVPHQDLSEPVNHDYNVLEEPKETGDEVDERAKDSLSRDPDRTSEDSDLTLEASKILHMEDNPAYVKPWKAKEDPGLPHELSDFLNVENNPAYSTPRRTKTAESCVRRRTYSL